MTRIPRTLWALGIVSLCMDASSELIHSLLPIFLVTTLGASMTAVGTVEDEGGVIDDVGRERASGAAIADLQGAGGDDGGAVGVGVGTHEGEGAGTGFREGQDGG